jgi:hypothetical protein
MGKLIESRHGDAARELMQFYLEKASELEDSGQYFMAAIALAFAMETAILAYFLVEFNDESHETAIPDKVNFAALIEAANEVDVLRAPIDIPSHVGEDEETLPPPPRHVAKDAIEKIRKFRNLIHPARALKESYDPRTFTREDLERFREMYNSVIHSLLHYI